MRPVQRAVEQLRRVLVHAVGVDLDAPQQLVPRVERRRSHTGEVEVGDLGLGVCACLIGRDEGYAHSCKDGRRLCSNIVRRGRKDGGDISVPDLDLGANVNKAPSCSTKPDVMNLSISQWTLHSRKSASPKYSCWRFVDCWIPEFPSHAPDCFGAPYERDR